MSIEIIKSIFRSLEATNNQNITWPSNQKVLVNQKVSISIPSQNETQHI